MKGHAHPSLLMAFQRILIAVDDSPIAAHAATVGVELARTLHGKVALLMVVDPLQNSPPESGVPVADLVGVAEKDARRFLVEMEARYAIEPPPLSFVPVGKPGTEIVKAAKDWPADVIVLGSHGRGGVSRLVLGSVAEAVMRHAPCPVLVIRSPAA